MYWIVKYCMHAEYFIPVKIHVHVDTLVFQAGELDYFLTIRLQNSHIFWERGRPSICERKASLERV